MFETANMEYDSGDDIFITQNTFHEVNDSIDTEGAVDVANSLLDDFDSVKENELLDFSNQKDNSSVLPSQSENDAYQRHRRYLSGARWVRHDEREGALCKRI